MNTKVEYDDANSNENGSETENVKYRKYEEGETPLATSSVVPSGVKNLRACMICHLVKTEEQVSQL